MGIEFTPKNAIEEAIHEYDSKKIIQAIAEGEHLDRLVAASWLGNECFSDEVIFSVLFMAISIDKLKNMTSGWFWGYCHAGDRIRKAVTEALTPLKDTPSEDEKKLIKAIIYTENAEVIRLINKEGIKFQGFTPELLKTLPHLSKEAALAFLRDGLSPKLKAIVLGIMLKEIKNPDLLEDFSYSERLKYTNLMLQIMMNEDISADDDWYPDGENHRFSYYIDPYHCFKPKGE